jgi:hypothetical protein
MGRHAEILLIKVGHGERVVKVTVDAPYPEELDTRYPARKAWPMRSRRLKRRNVTVMVDEMDRRAGREKI